MSKTYWYKFDTDALLTRFDSAPKVRMVAPLGGTPICCQDIRALAAEAHAAGDFLACDISQTGLYGCPAFGLGADAVVQKVDQTYSLVGCVKPFLDEKEALATREAQELLEKADERLAWRTRSDAAQVVASYLRCHPQVAELHYPGLREDASFEVATRTLQRGFGPFVDWRCVGDDSENRWHRFVADSRDARAQVLDLEARFSMSKH